MKGQNTSARIAPTPCDIRWGSYLSSNKYHAEVLDLEIQFLSSEKSVLGPRLPSTISDLCELLDEKRCRKTTVELNFLAARLPSLITALDIFQSDMSLGVFALSILDSVRLGSENLMELSDLSISDQVPAEIMRSWSNRILE